MFHHDVQLDYPPPCSIEEAQRHADRLREAGIEVSIVEAFSPSGQSILTGRSSLAPGDPQLYVLKVPKAQAEAAQRAHGIE
ncbi:MAG: hypothetical protein HY828_18660 [Actinobacteria bacterium]|nr:hypothetical protein [Actinomycetota bacterium]